MCEVQLTHSLTMRYRRCRQGRCGRYIPPACDQLINYVSSSCDSSNRSRACDKACYGAVVAKCEQFRVLRYQVNRRDYSDTCSVIWTSMCFNGYPLLIASLLLLSLGLLGADNVGVTRIGDGERRHAEVLTAGCTEVNVVCTARTHTQTPHVSDYVSHRCTTPPLSDLAPVYYASSFRPGGIPRLSDFPEFQTRSGNSWNPGKDSGEAPITRPYAESTKYPPWPQHPQRVGLHDRGPTRNPPGSGSMPPHLSVYCSSPRTAFLPTTRGIECARRSAISNFTS